MRAVIAKLASLSIALTACGSPPAADAPAPAASAPAAKRRIEVKLADVGLDAAALDPSVAACDDFYSFACGGWIRANEIPADKARWDRSFSEIEERNGRDVAALLDAAAAAKGIEGPARQVADFWASCNDQAAVEKAALAPIAPLLAVVEKVRDGKSLLAAVVELHERQVFAFFDVSGEQDFGDATRVVAQLDQHGLGLPDRDYYLNDDEKSRALRGEYAAHVERTMRLAGLAPKAAKAAAKDVLGVETAIARASKTRVERRDPKGLYNLRTRAELARIAPRIDWDAYFAALGASNVTEVNLTSVPFFEAMSALFGSIAPATARSYLAWHVVHAAAPALGKAFVDEWFGLRRALTGQAELAPRWKRCVEATDDALGEALAEPWLAKRFTPEAKRAAEQMVRAISAAFEGEVAALGWMDGATRARALEKLHAMQWLIGYPEKPRVYRFDVDRGAYAANVFAARAFDLQHRLARIGRPVDRAEWQMSAPTVNAYYDAQKNQMVFPAGILQPPFYSLASSVAVNLGAIGMVVGHELTHGFDDEGSQFDGMGNLANWWAPEVGARFAEKTACIEREYASFEALPGVHLDGKLTLGENIADAGGVALAFEAYRTMRRGASDAIVAEGFDEDQQFFVSLAQAWCHEARDEWARMAARVDPHAPPRFRVNGTVANSPEFAAAFACTPGAPMAPVTRCRVW